MVGITFVAYIERPTELYYILIFVDKILLVTGQLALTESFNLRVSKIRPYWFLTNTSREGNNISDHTSSIEIIAAIVLIKSINHSFIFMIFIIFFLISLGQLASM